MGQLSMQKYVAKCIVGCEVAYALCVAGGFLPMRSIQGEQLHHALFETLPGFTWISFGSFVLGAIYVLVIASIFGAYYVWMHNSSLEMK